MCLLHFIQRESVPAASWVDGFNGVSWSGICTSEYRCEFAGRLTAFWLIGAVWCYVSEVVNFNSTVGAGLEHSCHGATKKIAVCLQVEVLHYLWDIAAKSTLATLCGKWLPAVFLATTPPYRLRISGHGTKRLRIADLLSFWNFFSLILGHVVRILHCTHMYTIDLF